MHVVYIDKYRYEIQE